MYSTLVCCLLSTLFYSIHLFCSTLLCSTRLRFTSLYTICSALPCLLYSALVYSSLVYSSLLESALLCSTLLFSNLLYPTLFLYFTTSGTWQLDWMIFWATSLLQEHANLTNDLLRSGLSSMKLPMINRMWCRRCTLKRSRISFKRLMRSAPGSSPTKHFSARWTALKYEAGWWF